MEVVIKKRETQNQMGKKLTAKDIDLSLVNKIKSPNKIISTVLSREKLGEGMRSFSPQTIQITENPIVIVNNWHGKDDIGVFRVQRKGRKERK